VNNPVESMRLEEFEDTLPIFEMQRMEFKIRMGKQKFQAALFQVDIVVIVDAIDAYDAVTEAQTTLRKVITDKACGTRNKNGLHGC
jgi:hypothetical protein